MDGCTLAAAKRFEVDKFMADWLWYLSPTGYPLAIMVTRLQKNQQVVFDLRTGNQVFGNCWRCF